MGHPALGEVCECANQLLIACGLKQERIGDYLLAWLEAGENFLPVSIEHFSGVNLFALELVAACGEIDPVAIVEMENGIGRDLGVGLFGAAGEGRRAEHAEFEEARIRNFDTNFGSAKLRIEHRANVAHPACKRVVGICIELELRFLAEFQLGYIVLVNIADNPHPR